MSRIYLPWNASKARIRDAERARKNRAEIVRELSWGRVSRRDLLRMGLFTGAGMLASGVLRLPRWARLRQRQMESLAEQIALPGKPENPAPGLPPEAAT